MHRSAEEDNFVKIMSYLMRHKDEVITLPIDGNDLPEGKPKVKKTRCGCGGALEYGQYPFETSVNGERFVFSQLSCYSCSNCGHKLVLREVSRELEKRIDAARQKIVEDLHL